MDLSQLKVLNEEDIVELDKFLEKYLDDINYFKTHRLYKTYYELLEELLDLGIEALDEEIELEKKDENFESKVQCYIFVKGEEVPEEEVLNTPDEPITA